MCQILPDSLYLAKNNFMKNRIFHRAFVIILASICFVSCQITENIYLQEDGSGKISYDVDASELMSMMGDKLGEAGMGDRVDSTMTFKQLFAEKKDSIAQLPKAEQDRLKKLEDLSINMKINSAEKIFKMSLLGDFKKPADLQDMSEAMKSLQALDKKTPDASNPLSGMMQSSGNTDLKYSFDGKVFKRNLKIIDPKLQQQTQDSTGMMKMMFAGSQYIMKYHFPKKVKSVSNPNALYSEDRKTVTIPFSLIDYMESPEKMSFEVVLDKK